MVPNSPRCRSLEFHRADEVIDLGHELAADALNALERRASGRPELEG
jgi:hypothetical protein